MNLKIKQVFLLFFATEVALGFLVTPFPWAEKRTAVELTPAQMERLKKDLLEQQGELLTVDSRQKGILGEIERLEKTVVSKKESLREVTDKIQGVSREIKEGRARIRQLTQSSGAITSCLKRRLVAFYKFGAPGYLSLLVNPADLHEFQRTAKYMKAIMDHDRRILDALDAQRSGMEEEVGLLERNRKQIEALKTEKNARMTLLEKDVEKKVLLLMKVHREKEFYAKAVKELKGAAQALNRTMVSLEREEKEHFLPEGFAGIKGKVPMPVKGAVVSGKYLSGADPLMHRKGVYIKSSPGEKVRSVFSGRVDFSGWFKGYGQLLIINHGSRYFTILAHLDERKKKRGENVSAGEAVGLVGDPGWQAGPGVYFEIRRGRKQLDPKTWLTIE